ncbi:TPA: hypothetical protein ACF3I9_004474 [Klebsiella aerogenes]
MDYRQLKDELESIGIIIKGDDKGYVITETDTSLPEIFTNMVMEGRKHSISVRASRKNINPKTFMGIMEKYGFSQPQTHIIINNIGLKSESV